MNMESSQIATRSEDFYPKLRNTIGNWIRDRNIDEKTKDNLLLLPDLFVLLIRVIQDPRVDFGLKVKAGIALTYVMNPLDIVPDAVPVAGLIDDLIAVALTILNIVNILGTTGDDIIREHWDGNGDALETIRRIAQNTESFVNTNALINNKVIQKVKDWLGGKNA